MTVERERGDPGALPPLRRPRQIGPPMVLRSVPTPGFHRQCVLAARVPIGILPPCAGLPKASRTGSHARRRRETHHPGECTRTMPPATRNRPGPIGLRRPARLPRRWRSPKSIGRWTGGAALRAQMRGGVRTVQFSERRGAARQPGSLAARRRQDARAGVGQGGRGLVGGPGAGGR